MIFMSRRGKVKKNQEHLLTLSLVVLTIESYPNKFDATQKLWLLYKRGNSQIPKRITYSQNEGYTVESAMPSRNASRRGSTSNDEKAQEINRLFIDSILKAFIFKTLNRKYSI